MSFDLEEWPLQTILMRPLLSKGFREEWSHVDSLSSGVLLLPSGVATIIILIILVLSCIVIVCIR